MPFKTKPLASKTNIPKCFFFCNEKLSKSQVRARVNVLSMGGLCKETERGSKRWGKKDLRH